MASSLFDLAGRVALVTGGAQGLGRAIALGLARQGAEVAVADWNAAGAEDTAVAIQALGRKSAAFRCDVSQEEDVRRTVAGTQAALGALDILVNNAGITKRIALFDWQEAGELGGSDPRQPDRHVPGCARGRKTHDRPQARQHYQLVRAGRRHGGLGPGQRDLLQHQGSDPGADAANWPPNGADSASGSIASRPAGSTRRSIRR